MGQTLTHGVYLPDEGERNCYNGLAANWSILDGAVGTIAEHTTALAGKAPAVHTHTKSQITDFPAYGTTAGTICEGNDSRLSDARTPVAHTHTKSDVTDLLNSNFIPSANNSYDLGSSSYQWNNVYSKNYFYNGTAWGLDKSNVWSKTQDFVGENQGTEFSGNYYTCFAMYGKFDTVGKSGMFFTKYRPYKAQGSLVSSDIIQYGVDVLENEIRTNNVFDLQVSDYDSNTKKFTKIDVISVLSNANLGDSTHKWKTLNGINPGALSLPKVDGWSSGTEINEAIGIDTTNWDMSGGTWNEMTNNIQDGWVFFAFQGCSTGDRAIVRYYGTNARYLTMGFNAVGGSGAGYYLYVAFPMAKGSTVNIAFVTSGSVMSKFIYPCMGNV